MDEYVVLAESDTPDIHGGSAEWTVGTFEHAREWLEMMESQGYRCHVRRCTRAINIEFVREGISTVVAR